MRCRALGACSLATTESLRTPTSAVPGSPSRSLPPRYGGRVRDVQRAATTFLIRTRREGQESTFLPQVLYIFATLARRGQCPRYPGRKRTCNQRHCNLRKLVRPIPPEGPLWAICERATSRSTEGLRACQGGPPPMPRDPLPVAADLTRTPSAPPAPGRVEIDDRAVVAGALPQTRACLGVGEQFHGVPGDGAERTSRQPVRGRDHATPRQARPQPARRS